MRTWWRELLQWNQYSTMTDIKYRRLFEPITVAGTLFKNRLIASATGYLDTIGSREHGYYHTPEAAAYYERLAAGGVSAVTVGSCYVDKEYGDFGDYHVFLDDPHSLHSFYSIANSITRHGTVASAEIIHCGLYANRRSGQPSFGPIDMEDNGRPVYEMSEEHILSLIDSFANAAAFAKKCGFNMVTVHGGHGWLISQFVNPKLNVRKDKWGGPTIENRARLAVEICKAIRRKVGPGFPIEMRISGSECYEGGYGIDEGIALARQLDDHADLIHVSAGSHEHDEVFTITHPDMFMEEGCNSVFAAEIKKHVTNARIVTVGGFSDPEIMEEIVASGKADFVAMARSLLADPDLPLKLRQGNEINKCMRCLSCFSTVQTYGKFYCAINPKTGREYEEKFDIPPAIRKKVLVIGGGVGGMQAALTCAERGHEVILCEKEQRLGGALRCEEKVWFKQNLARYLDAQARAIAENPSIILKLDTLVTPAMASEAEADVIIAALGARPVLPAVRGIAVSGSAASGNIMSAEYAYMNPDKTRSTVVILGGGLVGVELGIFLAQEGRTVTVVEMMDKLDDGGNHLHAKGIAVRIRRYGINIRLNTQALEITGEGVVVSEGGVVSTIRADTVVYAIGHSPAHEEVMALAYCAPEFYALGDVVSPSNITNATSSAYKISRSIGRHV